MKLNLILLAICSVFFGQLLDLSVAQNTLSRAPAPDPNDCSECWCQCKRLSFRDGYGRTHGNCARFDNIYKNQKLIYICLDYAMNRIAIIFYSF